jgi:hypothetical protein
MKLMILLEVDATDIDWGHSEVVPCDSGMVDVDIDQCFYEGKPINFADDDKAVDYLIDLYRDSDQKCYRYA